MKNISRHLFSILLVLAIALCTCACGNASDGGSGEWIEQEVVVGGGGNSATPEDDTQSSEQTGNNNSTTSGSGNSAGKVSGTITFATWEDMSKGSAKANIIANFTKETGIKVKIQKVDQNNYITKLSGYKQAGKAPDVIIENQEFPRTLALLQPLSNVGINPGDSKFNQNTAKYGTVNGKQYLVSSAAAGQFFFTFYNKNVFKAVGTPTPDELVAADNWTWDTFAATAKKIHEYNKDWYGATISPSVFQATYGAGFIQYDTKTSKYRNATNDGIFDEVWRFMTNGIQGGYFYTRFNAANLIKGTSGMSIVDSNGCMANGYFSEMKAADLGVTWAPKKSKSDNNYPLGGLTFAYGIADGAKNPTAAAAFLNYYLDPENVSTTEQFINNDATELYHEALKRDIGIDHMLTGKGPAKIVVNAIDLWDTKMMSCKPEQLQVGKGQVAGQIDTAVKKANEIIANKK